MKLGNMKIGMWLKMAENTRGSAIAAPKLAPGDLDGKINQSDDDILIKNLRAIIKNGGNGVRPLYGRR